MEQKKLELHDEAFQRELFGNFDKNIKMIEEQFGIHVVLRDGNVVLIGDKTQVENAERLMHDLFKLVQKGEKLSPQTIYYSMDLVSTKSEEKLSDLYFILGIEPSELGSDQALNIAIRRLESLKKQVGIDVLLKAMNILTGT